MSRRLVVVRHAKAEDPGLSTDDHARPLTERGRRDARAAGSQLALIGVAPRRALVSDAARTRQTWLEMAHELGDAEVIVAPRLYHAELSTFVAVLDDEPDDAHTVLVVGHNPGLEELVRYLAQQVVALSTATALVLEAESGPDWPQAIRRRDWRVAHVLRPIASP